MRSFFCVVRKFGACGLLADAPKRGFFPWARMGFKLCLRPEPPFRRQALAALSAKLKIQTFGVAKALYPNGVF